MIKANMYKGLYLVIVLFSLNSQARTDESGSVIGGFIGGILGGGGEGRSELNAFNSGHTILGSKIGSTVSKGVFDSSGLHNTMKHFFKMEVGAKITYGTSSSGTYNSGLLGVLRVGSHKKSGIRCFEYFSRLTSTGGDPEVVYEKEELVGAACPIIRAANDNREYIGLFVETNPNDIEWK